MEQSLDKRVGFVIKRLDNTMVKYIDIKAKDQGIDEVALMHGFILGYLYCNSDKDIYQKDIEHHFSISRSHVTMMLKELEKDDLIRRESVAHDARLKKVTLTDKGVQSELTKRSIIDRLEKEMADGIDPYKLSIFFEVCESIRQNIVEKNERSEKT